MGATTAAGRRTALFLIDKPSGPTSHDIVLQVRRWTGIRRTGHAGTLDPLATGLLPVFVGPATRLIEYLAGYDKCYRATLRLGIRTDTDDAMGAVIAERTVPALRIEEIDALADRFRGAISQVPPTYSAVKVGGVTAHRAARRGEPLSLKPRMATIHALDLEDWSSPLLRLSVRCSTGTYVRAIARDLGEALGCGAHLIEMRRTAIGSVLAEEARSPDALAHAFADGRGWDLADPLERFFGDWDRVTLPDDQLIRVLHGRSLRLQPGRSDRPHLLATDTRGRLVAVLAAAEPPSDLWRPDKVLVSMD